MDNKTAMMLLIDRMEGFLELKGGMTSSTDILINNFVRIATELLSKEKEQIGEAFDKGGDIYDKTLCGEDYYNQTFNLNQSKS